MKSHQRVATAVRRGRDQDDIIRAAVVVRLVLGDQAFGSWGLFKLVVVRCRHDVIVS